MAALQRLPGLLLLALVWPSPSTATTLIELSTQEMTDLASDIVHGTCTDVRSVWIERNLFTLATISVTDTLKGDARGELTLVLPGGIDANRAVPVAVTWPGAPVVLPDDEVVLFLDRNAVVKAGFGIVGYSQGRYAVVRDVLGRAMASPARGMHPDATELASFKQKIREYASGQGRPGRTVQ